MGHFLPAGNSAVETKILCLESGNPSLPRRGMDAIVLAYHLEVSAWVTARNRKNQVEVPGGE